MIKESYCKLSQIEPRQIYFRPFCHILKIGHHSLVGDLFSLSFLQSTASEKKGQLQEMVDSNSTQLRLFQVSFESNDVNGIKVLF